MTIYWVSRHAPLSRQREALQAIFGPISIKQDARVFTSAAQILKRYQTSKADDIVVVAPDSVIRHLIANGIRPIRAQMEPYYRHGRRHYRFLDFQRVVEATLTLQPLKQGESTNGNQTHSQAH